MVKQQPIQISDILERVAPSETDGRDSGPETLVLSDPALVLTDPVLSGRVLVGHDKGTGQCKYRVFFVVCFVW